MCQELILRDYQDENVGRFLQLCLQTRCELGLCNWGNPPFIGQRVIKSAAFTKYYFYNVLCTQTNNNNNLILSLLN